jgi:hypothetical protein
MRNSRVPARTAAIGAAMSAITVNAPGLAVMAPKPMTTATSDSETSVAGQPASTKKTEASASQIADRMPASAAVRCDL